MRKIVVLVLFCVASTSAQVPVPGPERLQSKDLVYECTFRVPPSSDVKVESLGYGGTGLTYWPAHNSLLIGGHDWYQRTAEISIPADCGAQNSIDALARATMIQAPADLLQGKRNTIDGDTKNGVKVGGHLIDGPRIIVSAWSYYDGGQATQTRTHFVVNEQNFAQLTPASVTGPYQVGQGWAGIIRAPDGDLNRRIGGFVSGYMATIPQQWQQRLGGTHLTGQGGGVSVLQRTSAGPSASVFSPAALQQGNEVTAKGERSAAAVPATMLMGYPTDSGNPKSSLNRPTIGIWGKAGGLYDGTQIFRGMVFPDGTRSILFFGRGGTRFCYGTGTADPALDLKPVPGTPHHYCYDPVPGGQTQGTHGYPNRSLVFAYDVMDLIAAKEGKIKGYDVKPYATWTFSAPFQQRMNASGADIGDYSIVGAAYDPATRRIFLSAYRNDGDDPLIHVYRLPAPTAKP